jgi:hypothetical protein
MTEPLSIPQNLSLSDSDLNSRSTAHALLQAGQFDEGMKAMVRGEWLGPLEHPEGLDSLSGLVANGLSRTVADVIDITRQPRLLWIRSFLEHPEMTFGAGLDSGLVARILGLNIRGLVPSLLALPGAPDVQTLLGRIPLKTKPDSAFLPLLLKGDLTGHIVKTLQWAQDMGYDFASMDCSGYWAMAFEVGRNPVGELGFLLQAQTPLKPEDRATLVGLLNRVVPRQTKETSNPTYLDMDWDGFETLVFPGRSATGAAPETQYDLGREWLSLRARFDMPGAMRFWQTMGDQGIRLPLPRTALLEHLNLLIPEVHATTPLFEMAKLWTGWEQKRHPDDAPPPGLVEKLGMSEILAGRRALHPSMKALFSVFEKDPGERLIRGAGANWGGRAEARKLVAWATDYMGKAPFSPVQRVQFLDAFLTTVSKAEAGTKFEKGDSVDGLLNSLWFSKKERDVWMEGLDAPVLPASLFARVPTAQVFYRVEALCRENGARLPEGFSTSVWMETARQKPNAFEGWFAKMEKMMLDQLAPAPTATPRMRL